MQNITTQLLHDLLVRSWWKSEQNGISLFHFKTAKVIQNMVYSAVVKDDYYSWDSGSVIARQAIIVEISGRLQTGRIGQQQVSMGCSCCMLSPVEGRRYHTSWPQRHASNLIYVSPFQQFGHLKSHMENYKYNSGLIFLVEVRWMLRKHSTDSRAGLPWWTGVWVDENKMSKCTKW